MNECIKCGKEIPEGELFCIECSLNPGAPMFDEPRPTDRFPAPKGKMQTPQPVKYVRVQSAAPQPTPKRRSGKGLAVAFTIVTLLLVAVLGLVGWQYGSFRAEKNRLRTKEADLALRQSDMEELQLQYDALLLELETAAEEQAAKDQQIKELKAQLTSSQSSQSQGQYDLTAKQQELEQLQEDNQELLAHCEELQLEIVELEDARATLESALDVARQYKTKSEFMDSYVVFVENDGSGTYHTYGCSNFARNSFWAYSRKLAEAQGFHPCPVCKGTP